MVNTMSVMAVGRDEVDTIPNDLFRAGGDDESYTPTVNVPGGEPERWRRSVMLSILSPTSCDAGFTHSPANICEGEFTRTPYDAVVSDMWVIGVNVDGSG